MSKQTIYDELINSGLTHSAVIGIMGNLQAESGCEACRLQGDFELSRSRSKEYASKVDSGEISRHVFSRDGMGWGLYQLTYWSRKEGFYDFCKSLGYSISNENAQLAYMLKELKQDYPALFNYLCTTNETYIATKRFCEEFERPAINNVQARYSMAQAIESEIHASAPSESVESEYWPPRTIDKNMSGSDVEVLQSTLKARGYVIASVTGKFDDILEKEVKKFQTNNGLVSDGIVGPKSWSKLLEMSR